MNGSERREKITEMLKTNKKPVSGTHLAKVLMVSRQVIVQDIAILRAEGMGIIATPQGYMIPDYLSFKRPRRVMACIHKSEGIEDELKTIVSLGGKVVDVMVEHPVYGEMIGRLMISSIYDVEEFVKKLHESVSQPLLILTAGVHLHTVEADSEGKLDMIEKKLMEKGFLLDMKS